MLRRLYIFCMKYEFYEIDFYLHVYNLFCLYVLYKFQIILNRIKYSIKHMIHIDIYFDQFIQYLFTLCSNFVF